VGLRFQVLAASVAAIVFTLLLGGAVAARLRFDESEEGLRIEAERIAQSIDQAEAGGIPPAGIIEEALLERERARTRTARVLGQYALLTALVLLLLLYFSLTFLIVRPIDAVKRAADRIDQSGEARAPQRGPKEIVRLASSINSMAARQMEARRALEERLEALERAHRALLVAQDQVLRSEKLASVGRLSAGVAHEIGNPLAAIQGLLEIARDEAAEPELLTRAIAETERIKRIVRDLLDYARHEREDEPQGAGDVASAVASAVALLEPQKDLRAIRLETNVPGGLPLVSLSQDGLTQLLLNLLLNAADALGGEGGTVGVRVTADGARLRLIVEDDGNGFEPEALPHVFEPFFTTKPVGSGTGLGLSVAQTLVHRAEGSIVAENRAEGGARFVIELPTRGLSAE
jgi:two-component system, NtrC family, sensor kinase